MNVPEDSELDAAELHAVELDAVELDAAELDEVDPDGGGPATLASGAMAAARPRLRLESVDFEDDDEEEVLEVEPEPVGEEAPPLNGFHAFLRHANLHNLLQIESLSRTTGVFLVVSGGSRGYLHLANGELVHAETGRQIGEAAALEILSWEDGEFKSCSRTLAPVRTLHSSLQSLLMRLAHASGEEHVLRHHQSSRVVRRPLDQEAPTETYLPAVAASASAASAAAAAGTAGGAAVDRAAVDPVAAGRVAAPGVADPVAADRTAVAGRSSTPPPLPRPEATSGTDVVLSAAGEVIQGRGAALEELAARAAYAARLADLIGRAIRSGTPRGLELRGKTTQTVVQWQADGNLSASLDLPVPSRR